ncbi:MAG: DUF1624 domain-containing protein [Labilithrix sp.]|nr:DUF1624 domain-containing protein [Labilithrix sp.]MCW5813530.1 DUF1624 domain-containing protein [Labilithrix sp.]
MTPDDAPASPPRDEDPAAAPKAEAEPKVVPVLGPRPRVAAIDVLRGLVMVIMSIDHASEMFNSGRLFTDSIRWYEPGQELPAAQFFTRWITHLCAPTFVALAGTSLAISTESRRLRGKSEKAIDLHILSRGFAILLFEVVWMSPVMLRPGRFLFQVLYAIGGSLVCMVVLRRLGDRTLLVVGLLLAFCSEMIVGFFAGVGELDSLGVGLFAAGGFFFDRRLIVAYPIVPWLSMMCIGWAFGRHIVVWRAAGKDETRLATRALAIAGAVSLVLFALVRGKNAFGNMRLHREDGSLVQWLHVSKYPPSFTYVTLELGIAALLLAAFLWIGPRRVLEPLRLLGQTALFYYLLHIHVLKLVAVVTGTEGKLGIVSAYVGGLAIAAALYLPCRWYRGYKSAHADGWTRFV